ncbi:MAG: hypothetical protein GY850_37695 [bacterium]|nr:hypothetical protein [bacterium]
MLKNIMKAGLIAAMMLGTTSVMAADVNVGARYGMYFGQYNPGTDDAAARFQTYGESGLIVKASSGKASFTLHPEFRTGDTMDQDADEFYDVEVYGSYATPVGLVSIGTMRNAIAYGTTTAGGGVKAAHGGLGAQAAPTLAGGAEGDGAQLLLPLMDKSLMIQATVYDKALVKFRTRNDQLNQATNGTTQSLGVRYMGGPLTIAAGMTNETVDNYDIDTDDAETNTYTQFSAGYKLGNMSINVASVSALIKGVDKTQISLLSAGIAMLDSNMAGAATTAATAFPAELKISVTGLGFQMKDLGPGTLNLNYEAIDYKDTNEATGMSATVLANLDLTQKATNMSLFYSINVEPAIGYQFVYDTKAITPDGGDTTTKTYLGVGLYGRF